MTNDNKGLLLFEAIELRAEYDARLATLTPLLPENRRDALERYSIRTGDQQRPVEALHVEDLRATIEGMRKKRRLLNTAIQRANHEHLITVDGDELSLAEALELRKEVNKELGELSAQLFESAYARVIYKEERDIVEAPKLDYRTVSERLEAKRLLFRTLNRALQRANHRQTVNFEDE